MLDPGFQRARAQSDIVTEAPDDEFGQRVRDYLLANPEVIVEAMQTLEARRQQAEESEAQSVLDARVDDVFNDPESPVGGNPDGDVTMVEFFDYNCGYCRRAHADMEAVIEGDKNVRYVLKEFPILGPDSEAAHKVSDAVRKLSPENYGAFFRAMMTQDGRASEESALAIAGELGIAEDAIRAKMSESPNTEQVQEAYQLATSLGITGTPSYVIGNETVPGAVGKEAIEAKVANIRACGKATC